MEGIAFAVERLADDAQFANVLRNGSKSGSTVSLTSDTSRAFSRSMLHRSDVDWDSHGFDEAALDELAELGLRRGVARQLHEAIGAARALLKSSFTDSRLDIDVPLARHAISSVGELSFRIGDLSNPKPANPDDAESTTVHFRSLDDRDREMAVPRLMFTEPITTLAGATT